MKRHIGLILTLALAAGPAAAQGTFGSKPKQTWSPGSTVGAPTPPKSYGVPAPGTVTTPGARKTYGAPEAPTSPGFKPYEGYKTNPGSSVFGPDGKKKR
ncbi:MAG: hypothetical protein KKE02_09530 [Alphaproteobacteria bacterium]|nr:hypothetical protein [Alphaproteobacteria bacterium]MBU1513802.1 hypothetical protein [Alphaproteobacteria bacterium]MBU2094553.1 hypothetical protein [Alphaproteobacteria bacterium]MBU2151247.1 hypothetical protein [Alphaproteobacteria bacterium]MBU2305548.1 hypothetical protein [Alphaproteobacteria bacterium]